MLYIIVHKCMRLWMIVREIRQIAQQFLGRQLSLVVDG